MLPARDAQRHARSQPNTHAKIYCFEKSLTSAYTQTHKNFDGLVGILVGFSRNSTSAWAHELTGMRGHGYWMANQRVSSDVLLSMVYPFDPAWRGLVHGPGRGMWTFPDDYPKRVGDAAYQRVPAVRRKEQ